MSYPKKCTGIWIKYKIYERKYKEKKWQMIYN